jgi:hypothetical protein
MKQNLKSGLALALALVCSAAASSASALSPPTVPAECTEARDSKGWTAGRAAGESRLAAVWKSAAVHQNLDSLSDNLPVILSSLEAALTGLAGGAEPTRYVQCRAQGYAEGFLYKLNQLFGQCVLDGADWGQFSANVYCSLSIDLGGLGADSLFVRAPVGLCGNLFEFTCEDSYRYVGSEGATPVSSVVQSYLDSEGITLEPFPGCGPFTDGEFLEAFESSLHNDCTYVRAP